jgi:hypothetical protein
MNAFDDRRLCTLSGGRRLACGVLIWSLIYNSPKWLELRASQCYEEAWGTNITRLLPSEFRLSAMYYRLYYTYAYTGFMAIGPVLVLVVLNSLIVLIACRGTSPQPSTSVVLVVTLFIACNALGLVINMVCSFVVERWIVGGIYGEEFEYVAVHGGCE